MARYEEIAFAYGGATLKVWREVQTGEEFLLIGPLASYFEVTEAVATQAPAIAPYVVPLGAQGAIRVGAAALLLTVLTVPPQRNADRLRWLRELPTAIQQAVDATPALSMHALAREIWGVNVANGWDVVRGEVDWQSEFKIPCKLALIHSEVSEALEAFRASDRALFREELADILIRVLDLAYGLGEDMTEAVRTKLNANKTRGFRHGGKKA